MSANEPRLEIPLSKSKLLLLLCGALGFVAIGLWFIMSPPVIQNSFWGNPLKTRLAGYASVIFFGLCAFFLIRKLPDKRPGMIIDNNGLEDNSSGISGRRIPWSDISNISFIEIQRQKIILLEVKNPQEYISNQTSSFKKKIMEMNFKLYGTPLSLSSNGLKISFDELYKLLQARLEAARKR